jgi:hypothetical protein
VVRAGREKEEGNVENGTEEIWDESAVKVEKDDEGSKMERTRRMGRFQK